MFREFGGLLGDIIIFLYALTILNYVFKFINRNYRNQLMKNESVYKYFTRAMKLAIKNHKWFGMLTILFILLHFYIQYTHIALSITGVVAALIMALQVCLGIYGSKLKKRSKQWLMLHRGIATLLLVTILIHIA